MPLCGREDAVQWPVHELCIAAATRKASVSASNCHILVGLPTVKEGRAKKSDQKTA